MFHAIVGKNKVPVASFLLNDKSEDVYDLMMEIINEHVDRLKLQWRADVKVHVDFERALRNACLKGIPTCQIIGCCFHFSQALNRQADVNMRMLRRGKCAQSRKFKTWLALVRNLPLSELNNKQLIE